MKIGILTFHRAHNIGALLQASALQNYIGSTGTDCEIVDYIPNNSVPAEDSRLMHCLRLCKRMAAFPFRLRSRIKEKRFETYRRLYCPVSSRTYYGDAGIRKSPLPYDVLISGSDQILNTTLTGRSKAYYLDFFTGKKISYASSFGRVNITQDEIELVRSELPKFSVVSVREQSAAEVMRQYASVNARMVVDPVFLLSKMEWETRSSSSMKLPSHFVFVYSMEVSEALQNLAAQIRKDAGLPVIVVRGGGKPGRIEGKENRTCGPSEFLRYIHDADVVVTNSFHGIALSIVMGTDFYAVAHSTRNARIENILHMIGEDNKIVHHVDADLKGHLIHGKQAAERMQPYVAESKLFLREALDYAGESGGNAQ